jgi:hypothetical protein
MWIFKRFILSIFLFLVAMPCFYIGLFFYQFGAPIPAEYWVREIIIAKEDLARRSAHPKVLIVSGSNSLFGIDTPLLKKKTGMNIVNLGLHAGLALDQLSQIALRNAKSGDLVVMPLEYEYYFLNFETPSPWVIKQSIAWNPGYFYSLSLKRKWKFFLATTPMRVLNDSMTKVAGFYVRYKNPKRILRTPETILEAFENSPRLDTFAYDLLNINKDGDILNTCSESPPPLSQFHRQIGTLEKMEKPLALLLELNEDLTKKGARLVIAFPPIEIDPDKPDAELLSQLKALFEKINASSLKTLGEPKDSLYSRDLFFEIPYHLNCRGREQRTLDFAKKLKELG